jgi:hypothetical protein
MGLELDHAKEATMYVSEYPRSPPVQAGHPAKSHRWGGTQGHDELEKPR